MIEVESPAVDYEEGAEERYEAALNILAFSRKSRGALSQAAGSDSAGPDNVSKDENISISRQKIETADSMELEAIQQQLKEMQERIDAQLRMRSGQDKPRHGLPKISKTTRGKQAATSKVPEDNDARSESGGPDLVTEATADRRAAEPTVEDPAATIENGDEASADEQNDSAELLVVENGNVPAVPTDTYINTVNEPAPPSNSDMTANDALVKATVEKLVEQAVDAALTPPSDMPKDDDDLNTRLPVIKPTSNGVETPETTVADQATSPVEAEALEIDGFNLD